MPQFLKQYGEQLVALGYTVLPIRPGTKRPDLKNWPNHETTAADVVAWYSNGRAAHGAGINARNAPAIDVDVLDPDVAQQMSDAIDAIFPGERLMTRTGLAPKFLVPFRSDTPFRKMTSHVYTDGKNEHKVEILGDGQQWVAYHVHPDTERPYQWFDGCSDAGLADVERASLPLLNPEDARSVIDTFERIAAGMVEAGRWRVSGRVQEAAPAVSDPLHDDPFDVQPVADLSPSQIDWVVSRIQNNEDDYDRWLSVLCAIHHQLGEDGREPARAYSQKSSKHVDETFEAKYASLGSYKGPMTTLRTFIKETGQPPKESITPVKPGEFVQAAQFSSAQKVEWHIKHVIPKRGLIVVYGAPGSSKSFFVLDLVAHVARGLPWRGHRVKQSNVAYVAAEGVAGFGNRLAAYAKHNEVDLANVPVFVRGGSLLLNESTVGVIESVNALGDVGIVVIDTLAAVTPGANENTSEDMGQAIKSANLIVEGTGASVILIHHANKSGEMRGWSGLLAAADNTIRVEHEESTSLRTAHVEKQKEGRSDGKYGYRLRVVELGHDGDGDAITSCAVDPCEDIAPNTRTEKKERKPRSGDFEASRNFHKARAYLKTLEELIEASPNKELSMKDAIEGIQASPEHNCGLENHPDRSNVRKTIGSLADHGRVTLELGKIRLPDDLGDAG